MLDPQAQAILDAMPALPDFGDIPPDVIRRGMEAQNALAPGDVSPVKKVEDRTIPGPGGELPVRIYWPEGEGPFPALVFFHGGGFVLCSLNTHDGQCRSLANLADCVVVSVDYRLAPEHRFPAAPEDCYAATKWAAANSAAIDVDPTRIAIGGDSAGGNLAAAVSLMARDREGPALRFQLLIYPVTNFDFSTDSYRENAEGYFLTSNTMRWFWDHYLADARDGENAYASPLRAVDLSRLPPGLCITAGYDPLRDEGNAYAAKLRAAGVACPTEAFPTMFHGFFGMAAVLDEGKRAMKLAADALRAGVA